jgi:hypothetical protein
MIVSGCPIRARQQPQQLTDRRSGDIREILDREDFVCDGVLGRQDIQALTPRWCFDKQPLHTPEHPQKCPVDKVRGLHEEDHALAGLGFG